MNLRPTRIPDVLLITPRVFEDRRGYFFESYNAAAFRDAGMDVTFVQDNVSRSIRGVLRGLHLQNPRPQGKLVSVLDGAVYDVAADVRLGSPTFGQWIAEELSSDNKRQLYLPPGVAHGFLTLSASAVLSYKCTDRYAPESEITIRWDDPDLAIDWPIASPTLSDKDCAGSFLRHIASERMPMAGV